MVYGGQWPRGGDASGRCTGSKGDADRAGGSAEALEEAMFDAWGASTATADKLEGAVSGVDAVSATAGVTGWLAAGARVRPRVTMTPAAAARPTYAATAKPLFQRTRHGAASVFTLTLGPTDAPPASVSSDAPSG